MKKPKSSGRWRGKSCNTCGADMNARQRKCKECKAWYKPRPVSLAEYAKTVLDPTALTSERGKTHGDWIEQSACAQRLKQALHLSGLTDSQREALDMICVKISRICCGNPNEPDHWNDIMGYAKLARDGGHNG